jgi:hypothetical protein
VTTSRLVRLLPLPLLALALAAAVTSLWDDALVIDEVAHITAGYSYVAQGSLRLNPEHPPLVKEIAALPLLGLHLKDTAFLGRFRGIAVEEQWREGRAFLYGSGNDPQRIARVARVTVLFVFFVPLALLVYVWGRLRYGPETGLLAFVLLVFSPTVLAHARLVTTDVASATGAAAVVLSFAAWQRRGGAGRAALCVLALGAALLIKFSALLLLPFLLAAAVLHGLLEAGLTRASRAVLSMSGLIVAAVLLVVWPFYQWHMSRWSPRRQYENTLEMVENTIGDGPAAQAVLWASDKPLLRAGAQYAAGVLHVVKRTAANNRVFFLGETRPRGTALYFPVMYLLKEPLAFWALLLLVGIGAVWIAAGPERRPRLDRAWCRVHFEEIAMALWVALYWAMCLRTPLNLGVRHLLPTYPFAALLTAAALRTIIGRLTPPWRRRGIGAVALLAAGHAVATLSLHPSYLAFYNTLAGGPDGGRRYAVDSNLDWGQDLLRLAAWVRARGVPRIEIDYFGGGVVAHALPGCGFLTRAYDDPRVFQESEAQLLSRGESDGWIAVSISMLETALGDSKPSRYHWLAQRRPEVVIGHSIAVWHLTADPGR